MGIHGLAKLIADHAPGAIKEQDIKNYFGRKIAIDASMCIYQFLIAVRQDGNVLQSEDGETTSHLMGMFYRTIRMLENGIKPVYVFDGKPPQLKSAELEKRGERRAEAEKMLAKAQELGEQENIDKFSKRLVKVTKQHNDDCKKLLTLMGVPYIEAPCEAEASCAALVKEGKVFATATEDMDGLTFGTNVLLRHLTASEAKKLPVQEFHFNRILQDIGLTSEQFIDLCILLGCDYCGTIKGIGPKRAIDLIRQHGSIEEILENIDTNKHPAPEDWLYKEARNLFLKPEVVDSSTVDLKWREPDEEALIQFMCSEKQFSEDRIRNGCKKMMKSRQGSTQGRLDSFFSVTGSLSSKRKQPQEMKSFKIRLTFKSIHCVKKGLLLCWSAASRMCFSLAIISSLLTFQFVSGAADDCESIKNPVLFITTPENLEALSGSCLQVPCHFSAKERASFAGKNFGVWIKSDSRFKEFSTNVIFNSSGSIKTYPLEITGNMERQNCTTVFRSLTREHSDTYFFRIERTQFRATASCSGFRLTVRDSPWSPSINLPSDLKEHQSVTVTCSAFTPCPQSPPELTWNLQQDSLRQTEKNTDGTFTTKLQETITLSDTHDGYNISCSARYPVIGGIKTAETKVTLSVSYAPRNTSASISPSGLVSAGSRVELSCSSRAKPPPRFTWFRNNTNGATKVSVGPVYRLHMTNMTDLGSYYCEAENILGIQTSTPSHLKDHGTFWGAAAGGFIAIIVVICGAYILWRLKFKHSALRQSQNSGFQEPTSTEENQDIHYGDIDFSAMRPSLKTARDETDQQNVMYSEVKVHRTGNRTESVDSLYAQVKTKPVNPHFT